MKLLTPIDDSLYPTFDVGHKKEKDLLLNRENRGAAPVTRKKDTKKTSGHTI